jgi:simple sugar transport system ATP-binding protein
VANQDVRLHVRAGAFHAVIGENGAGKSTLLNILYGRYGPDAGRIEIRGSDVTTTLRSPSDAIRCGIGLVSQHHALIPALTVLENLMLGAEEPQYGILLRPAHAAQRAVTLANQLGLGAIDLHTRAERLSVAAQQKVEILKALYHRANILLLDEPTAMLAPQEADALFVLLHTLRENGNTVIFVTHKLREVMTYGTAVTVLRAGRNAGDFVTGETSEQELLKCMIGESEEGDTRLAFGVEQDECGGKEEKTTPNAQHPTPHSPLLQMRDLTVRNARRAVAVQLTELSLFPGEIIGVAGVDGSGQRELAEAVVGLRRVETGTVQLNDADITRLSVRERAERGIAYIPEDRHHVGMVPDFSIAENILLGHEGDAAWGGGLLLHPRIILSRAADMIGRYGVRVGDRGGATPASTLSGGNQQKVVIARALESAPRLLIACQPTRGLDVGAAGFVYDTLRAARDRGLGVLLFSLDLDELFALSDRIAVMFNGRLAGILPRAIATREKVGALMTGTDGMEQQVSQNEAIEIDSRVHGPLPEAPEQPAAASHQSPITSHQKEGDERE